jgi:hypothetical protein
MRIPGFWKYCPPEGRGVDPTTRGWEARETKSTTAGVAPTSGAPSTAGSQPAGPGQSRQTRGRRLVLVAFLAVLGALAQVMPALALHGTVQATPHLQLEPQPGSRQPYV